MRLERVIDKLDIVFRYRYMEGFIVEYVECYRW